MAATLSTLRLAALRRADMEGDPLVTDTAGAGQASDANNVELDGYVNEAIRELYALLVAAYEDQFLTLDTQFTLAGSTTTQALPATFFKARGVDMLLGTRWTPIAPLNFRERNRDYGLPRYHIDGQVIRISPDTRAAGTYRLWYVATAPLLTIGTDTLDQRLEPWQKYIAATAAVSCLNKAHLDASGPLGEVNLILKVFSEAADQRAGEPEQAPIPLEDDPMGWWV